MIQWSRWVRRIRGLLRPGDVERDMDAEMQLHLELEATELRAQGLSADEARRQAAISFGGVQRFKQEAREARPLQAAENVTRDIQLAMRQLVRSRGLAVAASSLLALGIGGTVAAFSILNTIHYRALPYPNSNRLVTVQVAMSDPQCGDRCMRDPDRDESEALSAATSVAEKTGTIRVTQGTLFTPGGAQVMKGAAISQTITDLLGMRPAIGRGLTTADFHGDAPNVLLLSHSAWLDDFGGDSSVVGRAFTLNEEAFIVAGVLSSAAELGGRLYSYNSPNTAQYVVPDRGSLTAASSSAFTVALIREGRSSAQLAAEFDRQLAQRAASGAGSAAPGKASVLELHTVLANGYPSSFWILFSAMGIVLLITCLNVTGLFLARLTDRANELATRTALGASRYRLAQQIGTETLVIAAIGGIGGVLLAYLLTLVMRLLPPGQLPFWSDVTLDSRAIALVVLLTIGAALIMTVAPIFVLSPNRLLASLRETVSSSRSRGRRRQSLVALQVALSVVLLGAAGVLAKVLINAERRDTGMVKHSMLYVFLQTPGFTNDANVLTLEQRISDELRRLPGVTAVGVEGTAPRVRRAPRDRSGPRPVALTIEGRSESLASSVAPASADDVSPAYFEATGTRILRGRAFAASDRIGGVPVAVVDESTARSMFGNESALGKRVKFGDAASDNPWMTIVGVSANVINDAFRPDEARRPRMYRSILQFPATPSTVVVRFSSRANTEKSAVRAALKLAEPSLAITRLLTIEESIGNRMFTARFNTLVLSIFALFAVLLSCLGIHAAVSIAVASRQREIAIRLALGALKREVVAMLVRTAISTVVVGFIAGLVGSVFAAGTLRSLLYGASPFNAGVYVAVAASMFATGILAALLPARRAARTDPARMLRM